MATAADVNDKQWFGHPRGLATLFFVEMWERFGYYGMRGLLVLFMTAAAARGGLGFSDSEAGSIYGLVTSGVYLLSLPGGWIADRLLGQRRSVFWGGVIISLGYLGLAIPTKLAFFLCLLLVVFGTGMLKPNASSIVGELYPEGGSRRDSGFSIFYSGINLGAFFGPIFCGYVGEKLNFRWGFALAGVGMIAGLIQYRFTDRYLKDAGHLKPEAKLPEARSASLRQGATAGLIFVAVLATFGWLLNSGSIKVQLLASGMGYTIAATALIYFVYLMFFGGLNPQEKRGIGVIFVMFAFSAVFWAGFEQAGSSLNLFAERLTDRMILGWEMPASWFQSINGIFIICFAPAFGALWQFLARRGKDLSLVMKFAVGLVLLSGGFLLMVAAANNASQEKPALPTWLLVFYLIQTFGELCISPVGLSSVSKLAPARLAGQMMGVWFMGISLGNLIAGKAGGLVETLPMATLFGYVALATFVAGVLMPLVLRGAWAREATEKMAGKAAG
ncbi:MAG: peptide MFS transporter [Thermoanaerobaculia bacterium]